MRPSTCLCLDFTSVREIAPVFIFPHCFKPWSQMYSPGDPKARSIPWAPLSEAKDHLLSEAVMKDLTPPLPHFLEGCPSLQLLASFPSPSPNPATMNRVFLTSNLQTPLLPLLSALELLGSQQTHLGDPGYSPYFKISSSATQFHQEAQDSSSKWPHSQCLEPRMWPCGGGQHPSCLTHSNSVSLRKAETVPLAC